MDTHSQLRQSYAFSDFLYYTALAAVPFFSAFYAIFNRSIAWLVLYILSLSLIVVLVTIRRNECRRCVYFGCPANKAAKTLQPNEDI